MQGMYFFVSFGSLCLLKNGPILLKFLNLSV